MGWSWSAWSCGVLNVPILLLLPVTWTSHPLVWCSDPLGAEVGQEADRASHQPDPQVSPGGLSPVPHTHLSLAHLLWASLCSLGGCRHVGGVNPRKVLGWKSKHTHCDFAADEKLGTCWPSWVQAGLAFPHSVFKTAQRKMKKGTHSACWS